MKNIDGSGFSEERACCCVEDDAGACVRLLGEQTLRISSRFIETLGRGLANFRKTDGHVAEYLHLKPWSRSVGSSGEM